MHKDLFAEIAFNLPLDKTFHYKIPQSLIHNVKIGKRVLTPFGHRKYTGYVINIIDKSEVKNVKEILSVIDDTPVYSEKLIKLAEWISKYYICSLGEALASIIPPRILPPKRKPQDKQIKSTLHMSEKPVLTQKQNEAVDSIKKSIADQKYVTFLLYGVTSSGKTEVYLASIEEAIRNNKSVIYLLPEISLTPQFINIVKSRFGNCVGLWHSRLTYREKYLTWEKVRSGEIKIMLGARSCVFAPFSNLGLIIMDEEHEPSYKQDQKPLYHTREVAVKRAQLENAVVILGSATPSIESFYKTSISEYKLLQLPERVDSHSFPHVNIVDARRLRNNSKIVSEKLTNSIRKILARREQAIIFLNRRGFSPSIMCRRCGKVWDCPNCSISLVFHNAPEALKCHYCGYHVAWPRICPTCKSNDISIFGVGTQKVEKELKYLFPQARIVRLDKDTAAKKGTHEQVYSDFKNEDVDILIGTQMIAKGFDFPRVTLVGVVNADTALYLPDFRSSERTFQLMTQVAGRSGRSSLGGEVIIQTRHPDHYTLLASQQHDYMKFYEQEIEFRRLTKYPPFKRLLNFVIRGFNEKKVEELIAVFGRFIDEIKKKNGYNNLEVLGPIPAARLKLHRMYRWQILIKGESEELSVVANEAKNFKLPTKMLLTIDMDPVDII